MGEEMIHVVSYDQKKRKNSRCAVQIKDTCEMSRTCRECLNVKAKEDESEMACYLDIKTSSCWDFDELVTNVPTELHLHWQEWIQVNGTTHNSSFLALHDIFSSQEFQYCKSEDHSCETCRLKEQNQLCRGLSGCLCPTATCKEMATKIESECTSSNVSQVLINDEPPTSIVRVKKPAGVKNTWLLVVLIVIAVLLVVILVGGFFLWRKYCHYQKLQLQLQLLQQQQQAQCTRSNEGDRVDGDERGDPHQLPFARPIQFDQVSSSSSPSSRISSFFEWCCRHFTGSKKKKQEEKEQEIPYANLQLFAPSAPHMDDVL